MKRTTLLALATALLGAGCVDLGLEDNIPEDEAATAPPTELVAAVTVHSAGPALIVDSRPWVPAGPTITATLQDLVPVGSAMGRTVYARAWDRRPYDQVFTRVEAPPAPLALRPAAWQPYRPVLGGGGTGRESAGEHGAEDPTAGHDG